MPLATTMIVGMSKWFSLGTSSSAMCIAIGQTITTGQPSIPLVVGGGVGAGAMTTLAFMVVKFLQHIEKQNISYNTTLGHIGEDCHSHATEREERLIRTIESSSEIHTKVIEVLAEQREISRQIAEYLKERSPERQR